VTVPRTLAEELRARFLELAPEGFEERDGVGTVELAAFGEAAGRVAAAFPDARVTEIEPGWEDRWREFHRPATVGPLWIGPPWESPPAGALPVVIDPGRAFGTGAHPTTRLCLELLLELPRGSVLDVGCGSGVLAIAAARLGFGPVLAVDAAAAATAAAQGNAAANGVDVDVRLLDATTEALPPAEIALANIALASVDAIASRLDAQRLVVSGYLVGERPALPGFVPVRRLELDGWAADLAERRRGPRPRGAGSQITRAPAASNASSAILADGESGYSSARSEKTTRSRGSVDGGTAGSRRRSVASRA
jgi:ribosomal protein L11 methyltransferase